jgi:hypothetical protein
LVYELGFCMLHTRICCKFSLSRSTISSEHMLCSYVLVCAY